MKRPIVMLAVLWIGGATAAVGVHWQWAALAWIWMAYEGFRTSTAIKRTIAYILCGGLVVLASLFYHLWLDEGNRSVLMVPTEIVNEEEEDYPVLVEGRVVTPIDLDGDRVGMVIQTDTVHWLEPDDLSLRHTQTLSRSERIQVWITLETEQEREEVMQWRRGERAVIAGTLSRPEGSSNFGGFDYHAYLRSKRMHWLLRAESSMSVAWQASDGFHPMQGLAIVDGFRQRLGEQIAGLYPEHQAGLMMSMVIGIRTELDPELLNQFSWVGLTHIMAISGLHVGVFTGGCLLLLRWLRVSRERTLTVLLILIPLYILLTGAAPSVIRAGLMAMIGIYAKKRGWLKDGVAIISGVALLLVLLNPYYLLNVSFQMSFLVTLGLILGVPRLNRRLPFKSDAINSAIAVTVVAQFVSFPVSAYYFNHYSHLSWIVNLLFVPVFSLLVLPISMIALPLSYLWWQGAKGITTASAWVIDQLTDIVIVWSVWQPGRMIWPSPPLWWIVSYLIIMAIGYAQMSRRWGGHAPDVQRSLERLSANATSGSNRNVFAGILLLIFTGVVIYGYAPQMMDRSGYVSFIDIGQGDAILIRTPEGKHLLVDGGGVVNFQAPEDAWRTRRNPFEVGKRVLVPLLKRRGVEQLDALFISHHDYDHMGALQAVLPEIDVKQIIMNGTVKDAAYIRAFYREAEALGIPVIAAGEGWTWQVDAATQLTMLHPLTGESESEDLQWESEQNAHSLVFLLQMYDHSFLLTGDVHAEEEISMVEAFASGSSEVTDILKEEGVDVMKLAHHGSRSSTAEEWLNFWQPTHAVVSAGRNNRFGHPHPEVTARLLAHGIATLRTDQRGEIQYKAAPDGLYYRTMLPD